jgi:hypothetical protein
MPACPPEVDDDDGPPNKVQGMEMVRPKSLFIRFIAARGLFTWACNLRFVATSRSSRRRRPVLDEL